VAAEIDLIQIREKHLTARVLFELTECVVGITRTTPTRVLVNDRADVAVGTKADGVHLATQSLNAATVRKAFGLQILIGASTHSLVEVESARAAGADLVVFGPIFETTSKQQYGSPFGVRELSRVTRAAPDFPVIALGGVSVDNARACFKAGAAGVAGISLFSDPHSLNKIAAAIRADHK